MGAGTENQISGQVGEALERPALRVREAKDMAPMACPAHRHLILASSPFLSTCQRASAQPTLRGSHHGRWMGQDPWPMRDTLTPSIYPSPALRVHTVPAFHGGGILWPCRAAWTPLQQDPLLPGPVSASSGTCSQFCPAPPIAQPHHPIRMAWPCL